LWTSSCTNREWPTPRCLRYAHSFSAFGWRGSPHLCIQAAREGKCLSLTCEAILAELAAKLRTKRWFDAAKATEATDEIRAFSSIITTSGALKIIAADPDDAVLECAIVARAEFIVSGDRHLLGLREYAGIKIVKAADFLKLLEAAQAPTRSGNP
jgi:putative PIN family toxin of toxin-antitoxin system